MTPHSTTVHRIPAAVPLALVFAGVPLALTGNTPLQVIAFVMVMAAFAIPIFGPRRRQSTPSERGAAEPARTDEPLRNTHYRSPLKHPSRNGHGGDGEPAASEADRSATSPSR